MDIYDFHSPSDKPAVLAVENAIILNNDANIYEMQFISFSKRKKKKKKNWLHHYQ